MLRVLITAGAGFIGSSLVNSLMTSGNCNIIVLDNLSRGSLDNISRWLGSPDFEFVQYDMLDYSNPSNERESVLQWAVNRSDIIFHLAANPDVVIGSENSRIDFQQNVQVTYNLLEEIRKNDVNLIQRNAKITERKKKKANLCFLFNSIRRGRPKTYPGELLSPLSNIVVWCHKTCRRGYYFRVLPHV